jgi:hypothetical protein
VHDLARVIATHNDRADVNTNTNTSRTYPVADLLLLSARGPAVIELAFDNGGIGSQKVTGIYELDPDDAPTLSAADREQLASAFAERGGLPANQHALRPPVALTRQDTPAPTREQPTREHESREWRTAQRELGCVQRARGDVTKLLDCAR